MKRGEKVFIGAAIVGITVVCAFAVMLGIATQQREAARAKIERPAAMDLHRQLLETASTVEESASESLAKPLATARERMAQFDNLFKALAFTYNDPVWAETLSALNTPPSEWPEDMIEILRNLVAAVDGHLDTIRALAAQDGPIYALDFSKGFDTELPHLAPLRNMARLLLADAVVALDDGDRTRVVDDLEAIYGLGTAVRDEPILISQLVRMAICGIAETGLLTLPSSGLEPEYYQRIMARLAQSDYREEFATCFAGEAACIETMFNDFSEEALNAAGWSYPKPDIMAPHILMRVYESPFAASMRASDEAVAMGILSELQACARLPYYEASPRIDVAAEQAERSSWLRPVTSTVLPSLMRASQAQARHEARLDLAQLGLSIEQYHDSTGEFPATLDAIADMIPGGIPVDPFTGGQYTYRVLDDSFMLYGVGHNLVDDGGRHDYMQGDIVWRGVEVRNR